MDKELLKKYNLTESQKRFKQILEYTFITKDLNEDGDDEDDNQDANGGSPTDMPDANGKLPTPDQMNTPDGQDMGGQQAQPQQAQGGNGGNMDIPKLEPPTDDSGNDDTEDGGDNGDEEEIDMDSDENTEEVDITDLTDAQEETNANVGNLTSNFDELIKMISSFNDKLDKNDEKIEDLKREIEKRNPTEVERLNLRSQDSMPFDVSPKDYWEKKVQDSNYMVDFDNSVSTADEPKEYTITKGEITNIGNPYDIANSFDDIEGDEYNQDLLKIFNIR